jgi:hypothetical protein
MPWSAPFDEPIPLPRGRKLVTPTDAGPYITKRPKAAHGAPKRAPYGEGTRRKYRVIIPANILIIPANKVALPKHFLTILSSLDR